MLAEPGLAADHQDQSAITGIGISSAVTIPSRCRRVNLATTLSNREMADALYVSVNTVKTHQRSIYQKLGASDRREAVANARTLGLL